MRGRDTEGELVMVMFRLVRIGLFVFLLIGIAVVALPADWEVDGVYLLDVTGSMVGGCVPKGCPENKENLAQAIDLLEAEILVFAQGTFVLIPFAVGPHDLDGAFGPIADVLSEYITDDPQDLGRVRLLRFLKPDKYGPYTDPETDRPISKWKGVLAAVMSGNQGRQTAIYDTLQLGLAKLDEFIDSSDETYLETHAQRLVILTDGRDTASKDVDEEAVRQALEERYRSKEKPDFLLTRYHWGAEPPPPLQGNTYRVDGPATFYRINLDRLCLRFPGNAWFSETFRLDPVCVPSIATTQVGGDVVLDWGEIQISTEDFEIRESGIPLDAVAAAVRPTAIYEDIYAGYCFPLEIELMPQSVLRETIERTGLVEGTVTGKLRFEYSPDWIIGRHAAFTRYLVGVEIPFQRPDLSVEAVDEATRIVLWISGNDAYRDFASISREQNSVRIIYDQAQFSLVDDNHRPLPSELAADRFLTTNIVYLIPSSELGTGIYQGEIQVIAPGAPGEVLINGRRSFAWEYELAKVGLDGPALRFEENIWAPRAELGSDGERTMILAGIRLLGVPPNWEWTRLRLFTDRFLFRAKLEARATEQNELDLSLEIPSLGEVELVKHLLNSGDPAGHIRFVYSDDEGDGQLVVIDPPTVPIYMSYRASWIHAEKTGGVCKARGADESALTITLVRSEDLLVENSGLDVQLDKTDLVNLELDNELAGMEAWGYVGDAVRLTVKPGLPPGRYRGEVTLRPSSKGVYLVGLTAEPKKEYRIEYCFDVEQCAYVRLTNQALVFGNPWIDTVAEGEAKVVAKDPLRFATPEHGPLLADSSLGFVIPQGGWPLPDGLLSVPLGEAVTTITEFRGEQERVELPLRELEQYLGTYSSDADVLEGYAYVENTDKQQCVIFETPFGDVEERYRIEFTIDVHRPWIRLNITPSESAYYHGGDVYLVVEANYDPVIPSTQRELAFVAKPDLFQVAKEASLTDSNQVLYHFTINPAGPLVVDQAGTIRVRCTGNSSVLVNGYPVFEYTYDGLDRQAEIKLVPSYTDDLVRRGELGRRLPGEILGNLAISGGQEFDLLPEKERRLLVCETLSIEEDKGSTLRSAILCLHDGSRPYVDGDEITVGGTTHLRLSICPEAPKGKAFEGVLELMPTSEYAVLDGGKAVYEYPYSVSVRHRIAEIILVVVQVLLGVVLAPLVAGVLVVVGMSLAQKTPPLVVLGDIYRRSLRGGARLLPFVLLGIVVIMSIAWLVIRGTYVR